MDEPKFEIPPEVDAWYDAKAESLAQLKIEREIERSHVSVEDDDQARFVDTTTLPERYPFDNLLIANEAWLTRICIGLAVIVVCLLLVPAWGWLAR